MNIIAAENFPPLGTFVLERSDRRAVLLEVRTSPGVATKVLGVSIEVWLLSAKFGGWYCTPDAGCSLESPGAHELRRILSEELR